LLPVIFAGKAHPIAPLHAVCDQGMSDLVAQTIEFAIGDRLIAQSDSF
jgi:hypothetical protein